MRIALLSPETPRVASSPPSGGYLYDERLAFELRAAGHEVDEIATSQKTDVGPLVGRLAQFDAVIEDELGYRSYTRVNEALRSTASRVRVAAIVHVPGALLSPSPETVQAERGFLGALDAVFFVSRTTLEDAAALLHPLPPSFVAAPGSDHFRPRASAPSGAFHIVTVGRLHPHKEAWDLVRALEALGVDGARPWRATIVGDASDAAYAAEIEAHVAASPLATSIAFVGRRSHDEIAQLHATAHAFLSTSRYESYCIAAAEALMAGVPVVGCARGGFRELVQHEETGLVVEPGDVGGLARALGRLRDDVALRETLARRARDAGARLPTWRDTAASVGRALAEGTARDRDPHARG